MQDSKECFKCKVVKQLKDFYKHPMMFDGHLNKCKECAKIDVQKNRKNNLDYYREYDIRRSKAGERKEGLRRRSAKWRTDNRVKRACHTILRNFMRNKERAKVCSECGREGMTHGHHDDYAKPLEVRWLCVPCHSEWHKENGEGING